MYAPADNKAIELTLVAKSKTPGNPPLNNSKPDLPFDPVRETFRDVSAKKLVASWWRVFWRIYRLQGFREALRVFPIVFMIIKTVRGFSRYHAAEYAKATNLPDDQPDREEAALTNAEYEEYRVLGKWLCTKLHNLGPTFIKIGQTLSTRADLLPLPAQCWSAARPHKSLPGVDARAPGESGNARHLHRSPSASAFPLA